MIDSPGTVVPGSGAPVMPPAGGGSVVPGGVSTPYHALNHNKTSQGTPGKARLVLDVPEDAKVFVDNQPTKSTSARRIYTSPELSSGESYFYDVRVEVVREGKTLTDRKRVIVKAGQEYQESFAELGKKKDDSAIVRSNNK